MAGFHTSMSPSKIEAISICPASYCVQQGLPERSKIDAVTGTVAHTIHERALKSGLFASTWFGEIHTIVEPDRTWEITVDEEMVTNVQESVDRCNAMRGVSFVEKRVDISPWTPIENQSGTADFFTFHEPSRTANFVDFKYGKGVRVFAKLNPQLIYYALGAMRDFGALFLIDRIAIWVHQPRLDHWDKWETTPAEIEALGQFHKRLLTRALAPRPIFHPHEKACTFCKAKGQCVARGEQVRRVVVGLFDDLDADIDDMGAEWAATTPSVQLMTVEQLVKVYEVEHLIRDFLDDVKATLIHQLMHDKPVPGLKVVESISRRKYRSDLAARQAAAFLVKQGVPASRVLQVKTVSVAQAEKLLPKALRNELADFWTKPPGLPTIVSENDLRPAYRLTTASMFEDLDAEPEDQAET